MYIKEHSDLELQVVAMASAVLDRYGSVVDLIESDGFLIDRKLNTIIEGESLVTMAKSTGLGLLELPDIFNELNPDIVLTVGDRYETMSTTLAASYMNITLAHTMGGEVTGTIDESIRHAITKFAQIHFPANEDSRQRIIRMGEDSNFVYNVGCPRIDLVSDELKKDSHHALKNIFDTYGGVGKKFDLSKPYLLVSQHSVTTEYGNNRKQIEKTLEALERLKIPTIMLWPAKSNAITGGIIYEGVRELSGFLEFIDLLHKIDSVLYFSFVKFSRTKLTSALLNIIFLFESVKLCINLNKLLWCSILNPFSVYPTNDVSVSGAYGGSRYTKSFGSTFVNDILKSQHSNITF